MTTKTVPLEPTEAMLKAGMMYLGTREDGLTPIYMEKEDALDCYKAMLAASPPSGGEVVYQQRTFGNRHETWRDIPKHEYDQLVLPSNGRILYPSPMVVDDDMLDAACEAYADMYDVEYIDGNNRDNRRACIKAALQAALEAK